MDSTIECSKPMRLFKPKMTKIKILKYDGIDHNVSAGSKKSAR